MTDNRSTTGETMDGARVMGDRLLNFRQVQDFCGLSRSTIYRMMRETPPTFPAPRKISHRAVRWSESELLDWFASRPRALGDFPP